METMLWVQLRPEATEDHLGLLPSFLDPSDERPAGEQFNEHYCSGWNPFKGHTLDIKTMALSYPGNPDMRPLFMTLLHDEKIFVYPYAWVLIMQPDGTYEIARMD